MDSTYVILALTVYAFVVTAIILIKNGHATKISKLKLPFIEIDADKFGDITPVYLFTHVSKAMISSTESSSADVANLKTNPMLMVQIGWDIVCGAYIAEYGNYPDDNSLHDNAAELGSQNVNFIKIYRDVASRVASHGAIPAEFAEDFFARSPSLADRITRTSDFNPFIYLNDISVHLNVTTES